MIQPWIKSQPQLCGRPHFWILQNRGRPPNAKPPSSLGEIAGPPALPLARTGRLAALLGPRKKRLGQHGVSVETEAGPAGFFSRTEPMVGRAGEKRTTSSTVRVQQNRRTWKIVSWVASGSALERGHGPRPSMARFAGRRARRAQRSPIFRIMSSLTRAFCPLTPPSGPTLGPTADITPRPTPEHRSIDA